MMADVGSPSTRDECQEPARAEAQSSRSWRRYDRETWLSLAVVYLVFFFLFQPKLHRPGVVFKGSDNAQIAEAQAWWEGRLTVPERWRDTALLEGRIYSHFPLLFTLVSAAVTPFFGGVPHWVLVVLLALPVPWLAFELCRRLVDRPGWAALLAIGLVGGTSLWIVLKTAVSSATPYQVNHTLAFVGLAIFLIEFLGKGRVWVSGMGLLIASLARQLTVAYMIPLLWLAWRRGPAERRWSRLAAAGAFGIAIAAIPMVNNALKFGHPLRSGYMLIYEGRPDDDFAGPARQHGLFSLRHVPRNLYYANLGFWEADRSRGETVWKPNKFGTGIWWTTPLLLWLWADLERIVRDPARRALLAGAVLVFGALMCFHATGAYQRGYNRFSLDYLPVLFVLAAPAAMRGWRRWVTLVMVVWSVTYFRIVLEWPRVDLW